MSQTLFTVHVLLCFVLLFYSFLRYVNQVHFKLKWQLHSLMVSLCCYIIDFCWFWKRLLIVFLLFLYFSDLKAAVIFWWQDIQSNTNNTGSTLKCQLWPSWRHEAETYSVEPQYNDNVEVSKTDSMLMTVGQPWVKIK